MARMQTHKVRGAYFFGLLAAILCAALAGCALSPHGGLVPIWTDTTGQVNVGGGDGSSFAQAKTLRNGGLHYAKHYEISWLLKSGVEDVSFNNYGERTERMAHKGKQYDVIRVNVGQSNERRTYFDLSGLRPSEGTLP